MRHTLTKKWKHSKSCRKLIADPKLFWSNFERKHPPKETKLEVLVRHERLTFSIRSNETHDLDRKKKKFQV